MLKFWGNFLDSKYQKIFFQMYVIASVGQEDQKILQKNQQIGQGQTRRQPKIRTQLPDQQRRADENFELSLQEKFVHEPKRKPRLHRDQYEQLLPRE